MKKIYQIVKMYNICGRPMECLCDVKTTSGDWFICYSEESAKKRVQELHEAGHTTARYEEVAPKDQWWSDKNWIG